MKSTFFLIVMITVNVCSFSVRADTCVTTISNIRNLFAASLAAIEQGQIAAETLMLVRLPPGERQMMLQGIDEGSPDILVKGMPAIGFYVREIKGSIVLRLNRAQPDESGGLCSSRASFVKVPRNRVERLPAGGAQVISAATEFTKYTFPTFAKGEWVRYRDEFGLLKRGRWVRDEVDKALVIPADHERPKEVSRISVFKAGVSDQAFTPRFAMNRSLQQAFPELKDLGSNYIFPDTAAISFLDAAARITSAPEFAARSTKEQLKLLMEYYQIFMAPEPSVAPYLEHNAIRSVDQYLQTGIAGWRQNISVMGTLLAESGFEVRQIISEDISSGGDGGVGAGLNVPWIHGFLEVLVPSQYGETPRIWIVDPAAGIIETPEETRRMARLFPDSNHGRHARYYQSLQIHSFTTHEMKAAGAK